MQASDPELDIEKKVYMYRAYLALKKFGVVRDEIGSSSPVLLQPLKTLMAYIQSEGNSSKRYCFCDHFQTTIYHISCSQSIKISMYVISAYVFMYLHTYCL